jgi:uncharacterized membrane protein YphA (DoxX/SURF4 family)
MPEVLAVLTVIIELGAGLLLVVGWKRVGPRSAFLNIIPMSLVYHSGRWKERGPPMNDPVPENVSIMGGALVAAFGRPLASTRGSGQAAGWR